MNRISYVNDCKALDAKQIAIQTQMRARKRRKLQNASKVCLDLNQREAGA